MKEKFIVILLSFFIINLPAHADNLNNPPLKQQTAIAEKINLNKADVIVLTGSFKGIGKKRAAAIIAYRENHHGFKTVEELGEVKGIGRHFIDVNREQLNKIFMVS